MGKDCGAGSLPPFSQLVGGHEHAGFLYHCLSFNMCGGRCFGGGGCHLDSWPSFCHPNRIMALPLGQICHSQALEVALADLGLSAVLLSSDSWDRGSHCFPGPQTPPCLHLVIGASSCMFLGPQKSLQVGPSAYAFYDDILQRTGGAQPTTG